MLASYVLVSLACLIGTYTHLGSAVTSNETQFFNSLLQDYDKDASPYQVTGKPTEVKISFYILSIDISNENAEMTFTCYLRMGWDDPRLKEKQSDENKQLERIRLPDHSWEKIWIPDIFIRNAISTEYHEMATPNRLLMWKSSGSLWYAFKVTVVVVCDSENPERYPFETLVCHLHFESYGYTMDRMKISAANNSLEMSAGLKTHGFLPVLSASSNCSKTYTSGSYPCLDQPITFKRVSSFVSTVCIPSILLVIVSWISFWIDKEATTARLMIGLLSLITLTLIFTRSQDSVAFTSQTTMYDVWLVVSFIFILASILEYFLIVILSTKRGCDLPSVELESAVKGSKEADNGKRAAGWIDWISRIAFPIAFAIFVIVFFCL